MKNIYKISFIFSIFTLILSACEWINPEEKLPGYIYIDSVIVNSNYSTEGTNSQKVSDVWIYVEQDGEMPFQGAYELPAKFPVLKTGQVKIRVYAGIKNNGISASRKKYPFYEYFEVDTVLSELQTMVLNPVVKYKTDNAEFVFMEDFEDPGKKFVTSTKSDTTFLKSSIDAFEGSKSGLIILDSLHSIFECKTIDSLILPLDLKEVYIEMNYKSNLDLYASDKNLLAVGFFYSTNTAIYQETVVYLNSTNGKWNKIYIDLTNTIASHQDALYFRPFIGVQKSELIKNAEIGIDNFKIIKQIK